MVARGYIERHNTPPVHNFVSLAGPVNGVYGVPDFNELCPDNICPWLVEIMDLISEGGYAEPVLQHLVTFAQYWRDPIHYQAYLNSSAFLADINNERETVNPLYKKNFVQLNAVALILAELDRIVIPKESEHFGYFALGNDTTIVPMNQTRIYQQDLFGLKTLDEAGRLHFFSVPCGHQNMPRDVCKNVTWPIIQQYTGTKL
jgi:palmitoyl-protein thioesterase